jgi:hypothetical protein
MERTENPVDLNNAPKLIKVKCEETGDEFEVRGRPCELSAFSYVPPNRIKEPANRNIYNFKQDTQVQRTGYDQLFSINYGFDNKIHRCDRRHAKLQGLDVGLEDQLKAYPNRSSGEYGKLLLKKEVLGTGETGKNLYNNPIDPQDRKNVRIMRVKAEFYNRNGINDLSNEN